MATRMELGELVWKITGDKSGFDKSVGDAKKSASGLGSAWKKAGGIIAGALAAVGVSSLVKSLINAASEAEEVSNKFGVVFRDVINEANKMAANLAANYMLSRTEAKKLLSDTGDLLSGFGVAGKEALTLSYRVQTLAADLASFSNVQGGVTFASQALTKGLFGETEQMKSLGIVINQNGAEFKNLIKYYQNVEGKTLQQAKAYTILRMATAQSGNAINDVSRSMDSFANQSRIAQANISNLKEGLGKQLLPVATLAVKAFNSVASELDKTITQLAIFVRTAEGARVVGDIIGGIAGTFSALKVIVTPVIKAVVDNMSDLIKAVKDIIAPAGDSSSALVFLSGIMQFAAKVSRLFIVTTIGTIRTIINLAKVVYDTGLTMSLFYQSLIDPRKWGEFKDQVIKTGGSFKALASGVVNDGKKIMSSLKDLTINLGKDSKKLARDASTAYKTTAASISASVQSTLLAKQSITKQDKKNNTQSKKNTKAIKDEKAAWTDLGKSLDAVKHGFKGTNKEKNAFITGLNSISSVASDMGSRVGAIFTNIMQIMQGVAQARIAALDSQMQKELEAAGVAEETTIQKLESEIAAATRKGDKELVIEKQKELKREKIKQKFAKKRAEMEYQIALLTWKFQLAAAAAQLPLAVLNAYASGFKFGIVTAGIYAGLAGVAGALQVAAVAAAKPEAPSFEGGGIMPGESYSGDKLQANVNSGEMILNSAQQRNLFDLANNGGNNNKSQLIVNIGPKIIYDFITEGSLSGEFIIDERSVKRL